MRCALLITFLLISKISLSQFKGSVQAGGSANFGNYSMINLNASADLKREKRTTVIDLSPSYRWTRKSVIGSNTMTQYEDEAYLTASWSKTVKPWKFIAFSELDRSFLRKVTLRSSLGVGIGHRLIKTGKLELVASEVILPEYFISYNQSNDNFVVRASTRFRVSYETTKALITSVTLIQPALYSRKDIGLGDNLNVRSINSVTLKTSQTLSIGLSYLLIYQGYPHYLSQSIKPAENDFTFALKYQF